MRFNTADLCDAHASVVQVADPVFRDYGGQPWFWGPIETVKVFEDNGLVRQVLETAGQGRVLIVDGGGSLRSALLGGRLALLAQQNGWSGLLVNGAVRDSAELQKVSIGIRALNTVPIRSARTGAGERSRSVAFAGVVFSPQKFLYADSDGIVVADQRLLAR